MSESLNFPIMLLVTPHFRLAGGEDSMEDEISAKNPSPLELKRTVTCCLILYFQKGNLRTREMMSIVHKLVVAELLNTGSRYLSVNCIFAKPSVLPSGSPPGCLLWEHSMAGSMLQGTVTSPLSNPES